MEYLAMIEDFISTGAVAPAAPPTPSGRIIEPTGSLAEAIGLLVLVILVWLATVGLQVMGSLP